VGERGSVTVWLVTASLVMLLVVGLAVDLTGQVAAQQNARDVAAQAARTGGQQLSSVAAVKGNAPRADTRRAADAARNYLAGAPGLTGTVQVTGGDTVTVTTRGTYRTKILSVIGLGSLPVSGTATSRSVRAVGGVER
jgi:hypothetical protein